MRRFTGPAWAPGGVLSLLLWGVVCFALSVPVPLFAQEKPEDKLLSEVAPIYERSGEAGLQAWMKGNRSKVRTDAIAAMAKRAVVKRAKEHLDMALVLAEERGDRKCQADVLYQCGEYCRLTSDHGKAEGFLERALAIYEALGDTLGQGAVVKSQGDILAYTGEDEKALALYEKALPLFEKAGDLHRQGNLYKSQADVYLYRGEYDKALPLYEKALRLFEKCGDTLGQGNVCKREGDIFLYETEGDKALAMYEKALLLYEKAEDTLGQASVYKSEGDILLDAGENERAIAMYEKALPLFEGVGDVLGQGNVYKSEGNVYLYTGENEKAVAMYGKALPFYVKAGDHLGQGNVCFSEGEVCRYTGESAKALEKYEKALPLFEKAGEPTGQGNVYRCEGEVYLRAGDSAKALAMYEKALPLFEKGEDKLGQASIYFGEGELLADSGESEKALAMYEKALSLYEKAGEPLGQGNMIMSEGDLFLDKGESAKARASYEKAMPLLEKAGDLQGQGYVCIGEGDLFAQGADHARALEMYLKASELFVRCGNLDGQCTADLRKARALAATGRTPEASLTYEEALALLERARAQTVFSEMKKSFLARVSDQYEEAARFMLENGEPEKAFRIAESLKARVFLDSLAEGLVNVEKGISPDLREGRDYLTGKLSAEAKAVSDAASAGDAAKLDSAREKRSKTEAELEKLQMAIRLQNPLYASVQYPQPASLREIQASVLRPGESLVEYFVTKEVCYAFVASRDGFKAFKLGADARLLQMRVRAYLDQIGSPPGNGEAARDRAASSAENALRLYEMLVKPLERAISKSTTLIIVPDGELCRLPFESLVVSASGKGSAYLIEKHSIKYAQSASVLAFFRTRYAREGTADGFIGFGDPVYDYGHFMRGELESGSFEAVKSGIVGELTGDRYFTEGGALSRLQGSGDEVRQIAGLFEKSRRGAALDLRLDAREENAKSRDMRGFGYVHFACHGLLGDGFQNLALSQIPGSKEDGFLTLNELMNCDWDAKLVVLSACQTGKGRLEKGEGVSSLARAVMYAGSPAAVVSLWSVSDVGTKELMLKFYKNLLDKKLPKDEALRQAKVALLKSRDFSSPFFWSPFVMYGE